MVYSILALESKGVDVESDECVKTLTIGETTMAKKQIFMATNVSCSHEIGFNIYRYTYIYIYVYIFFIIF